MWNNPATMAYEELANLQKRHMTLKMSSKANTANLWKGFMPWSMSHIAFYVASGSPFYDFILHVSVNVVHLGSSVWLGKSKLLASVPDVAHAQFTTSLAAMNFGHFKQHLRQHLHLKLHWCGAKKRGGGGLICKKYVEAATLVQQPHFHSKWEGWIYDRILRQAFLCLNFWQNSEKLNVATAYEWFISMPAFNTFI